MAVRESYERNAEALGRDVSFLGRVLGDVLREQGGDELFSAVEGLRQACRHMRHHACASALEEVRGRVEALPLELALDVVRAYTLYFHLINMAEENHRLRRIAERESGSWPEPRYESIAASIKALADSGMSEEAVDTLVQGLSIRPVFTAHPTEARRMTVLRHLRRIATLVDAVDDELLTPQRRDRLIGELYAEVTNLWQTNELRTRQQTVQDEVRNGLYYLDQSVFEVTATLYQDLHEALESFYPSLADKPYTFLTYGSWIGGDRDGNPNVTASVTREALAMHAALIVEKYINAARALLSTLSVSTELSDVSEELRGSIERDAGELESAVPQSLHLRSDEPYRQKLAFMLTRLLRTRARVSGSNDDSSGSYDRPAGLLDDLELIARSLRGHRGSRLAGGMVQRFAWQVRAFGFHLARLDIRQHRDRHLDALDEILALNDEGDPFSSLSEDGRVEVLHRLIAAPPSLERDRLSSATLETLDVFDVIAEAQLKLGAEAVDTYIVSFTRAPSDLLAVLFFARMAGLFDPSVPRSTLRVVPLFETEDDLESAPSVMNALWSHPIYRQQLTAWGNAQEIMLGYSDSDKDAGFCTSNWLLYRAQQELTAAADAREVALTFFHGRGGAIGRGGGPLSPAILGQPIDTVRGRIKVTEQGEVLFTRYANPGIAHRHLEQVVHAVILASRRDRSGPGEIQAWEETAGQLSHVASATYRDLVRDDPGFLLFFEEGTPLRSIMRLRIASRPPKRSGGQLRLQDLRAIPWVFAWTQSRYGLPGWYGLGTALTHAIETGELVNLRHMYRRWPFFRWLIDSAQISLGKADLLIASEYAELVPDADVRVAYGTRLHDEYERTCGAVNQILHQEKLLDSWSVLQRSIALRNPYVDPMSFIQVRAIREVRQAMDEERAATLRSIIDRSVTGIAAGLQNTG